MSDDTPFSLAIATPMLRGNATANYVRSVFGLQRYCAQAGIPVDLLVLVGVSIIDHARNILASRFLYETQCSHLLFVDDDIGFNVDELVDLLAFRDRDVVGAMCPKRSMDWARIKEIVLRNPDIDPKHLPHLAGDYTGMFHLSGGSPNMTIGPKLIEVDAIGTGLMMISRDCLRRLIERVPLPPLAPMAGDTLEVPRHVFFNATNNQGEDIAFCQSVRHHGGRVFGLSTVTVTHTGLYDFIGDLKGIARYED
ncbi:hypothetical protein LXM94_25470 [Rhizobium sp. TRM95111]|uniref:hypothetical protein n=1 Tax=Rhizobium alarense TaxID=2846851 RepID=UPI001F2F3CD7|nr:hypothetical protein [Rhizobium alarense]MCF3643307.1 hypothetical protein [Rhizobium alarense]